jgi:hypothetical protein
MKLLPISGDIVLRNLRIRKMFRIAAKHEHAKCHDYGRLIYEPERNSPWNAESLPNGRPQRRWAC